MALRLCTQAPIQRRANWPSTKGSNSCSMILPTASNEIGALPALATTVPTSSGVRKMPSRLEADALHTAAGTLPRAIDVKAMADCTVAGRQHKNRMPRYSSGVTKGSSTGLSARPSKGNIRNVAEKIVRCSFQCVRPAMMASRDRRAPCRKNSRPTAMFVIQPNITTP